jgi:cytoplasmic iron level regulating protein YaaA (DUF328/UPF0246 family)
LGIVEWQTPLDVQNFMEINRKLANQEAERTARFTGQETSDAAAAESASV